jgi:hypothetical protein
VAAEARRLYLGASRERLLWRLRHKLVAASQPPPALPQAPPPPVAHVGHPHNPNTPSSPSPGPPIHHFDLYRLGPGSDLGRLDLGASFGRAACLVEWPERLPAEALPAERLEARLEIVPLVGGRAARGFVSGLAAQSS